MRVDIINIYLPQIKELGITDIRRHNDIYIRSQAYIHYKAIVLFVRLFCNL